MRSEEDQFGWNNRFGTFPYNKDYVYGQNFIWDPGSGRVWCRDMMTNSWKPLNDKGSQFIMKHRTKV
jgi:hypothetical protein